jgi:hypothetical protein
MQAPGAMRGPALSGATTSTGATTFSPSFGHMVSFAATTITATSTTTTPSIASEASNLTPTGPLPAFGATDHRVTFATTTAQTSSGTSTSTGTSSVISTTASQVSFAAAPSTASVNVSAPATTRLHLLELLEGQAEQEVEDTDLRFLLNTPTLAVIADILSEGLAYVARPEPRLGSSGLQPSGAQRGASNSTTP